jgi:hypothetical protein
MALSTPNMMSIPTILRMADQSMVAMSNMDVAGQLSEACIIGDDRVACFGARILGHARRITPAAPRCCIALQVAFFCG